jgi:serine/threonine-protein kinase
MADRTSSEPQTHADDPAARLERLWAGDTVPDFAAFLASLGALSPAKIAALARIDQRHRWQAGQPVRAEIYLQRHPEIAGDAEAAVDLIYGEFLLREKHGEAPSADEYAERFPPFAMSLRQQIELHQALGEEPTLGGLLTASESSADRTMPSAGELLAGHIPETFGRYRILGLIGRGGMGAVYRARDTALDRLVALKVILTAAHDDLAAQRFQREARAAAGLSHPNLCPVHDGGAIDGVPYLTMPLVAGKTLAAVLRDSGPLPEEKASCWAAQLARAMQAAHDAGVVHRDLKPSNVVINERDEPVIIDFGLAALAHEAARLTPSGGVLGTPAYLPPELIGGSVAEVGPAADVYSLGAVLYEMLAGRAPFQGSLFETIQKVKEEAPEPPSRVRPGLSPRLERVCLRALAKDPRQRFASMAGFAAALEGDDDLPAETATRPAWRRLLPAVIGAVALLALAIALMIIKPWSTPPRGNAETTPPTAASNLLPAGSRWAGTFRFREPIMNYHGDVELVITERSGDSFNGEYATENDGWRWAIAGRIEGNKVSWTFTAVIKEREPREVVGKARVDGTLAGDTIRALFTIPGTANAADLELRPRK